LVLRFLATLADQLFGRERVGWAERGEVVLSSLDGQVERPKANAFLIDAQDELCTVLQPEPFSDGDGNHDSAGPGELAAQYLDRRGNLEAVRHTVAKMAYL